MDITLQDVIVVVGSIVIFTAIMLYKDQAVAFVRAAWRERRAMSGALLDQRHAAIMASRVDHAGSEALIGGSRTGSADPVPPQQNQVEPEAVRSFEDVLSFLTEHKLSDEEAADLLAVAARAGGYLLSANKIRDAVGGSDAAVKARVAARRPKSESDPLRSSGRLERPEHGWN